MKKIVLQYGLISGSIVSTTMALGMLSLSNNHQANFGNTSMIIGYLSMLVAFSFVYVAVKKFRDNFNNQTISFGKAFAIGISIVLIASTMYVITWAFIHHNYMPDFMDKYAAAMIEDAQKTSTAKEIEILKAKMDEYKVMYKNPFYFALFTYGEIIPIGVLVSIVSGLLLKRKK